MNTTNCFAGGVGIFLAGYLKRDFGLGGIFAGTAGIVLVSGVLLLLGLGFLFMVVAANMVVGGANAPAYLLVLTYLLTVFGELCVSPVGLSTVTSIALGGSHACALLDDATARCWGDNGHGQFGDGTSTSTPTPIAVSFPEGIAGIAANSFLVGSMVPGSFGAQTLVRWLSA